jgi:hypothetical protein
MILLSSMARQEYAKQKRYRQTAKGKATHIAAQRRYRQTANGKATISRRQKRPKVQMHRAAHR